MGSWMNLFAYTGSTATSPQLRGYLAGVGAMAALTAGALVTTLTPFQIRSFAVRIAPAPAKIAPAPFCSYGESMLLMNNRTVETQANSLSSSLLTSLKSVPQKLSVVQCRSLRSEASC